MARIRTIKPEFFRDEELQDLEAAHPRAYPMLVFAALWGHCDKNGTFEWKPRNLKLDILPFLPFNMDQALEVLEKGGFIKAFVANGKKYGHIPNFKKHQRINGKEAQEAAKHPLVSDGEEAGKQQGSNGEAVETTGREGKGMDKFPGASREAPDGFLKFWNTWPTSSRKGGRTVCLRKWLAKGCERNAAAIVAHVESLKASRQWADPEFIPAPLTYLNQSRWDGAEAAQDDFAGMLHG